MIFPIHRTMLCFLFYFVIDYLIKVIKKNMSAINTYIFPMSTCDPLFSLLTKGSKGTYSRPGLQYKNLTEIINPIL